MALDGALPAWRSLSTSSDDGADIAQLEASLVALGYDPALKVTVDNHFDSATRTMVKAWQEGLGIEQTGTVALGSVVFLPSASTVTAVDQAVGDTVGDGDTVLTLAAPTQEVQVEVPSGDESQVVPGLVVQVGDVQGTVTRLRSADRSGTVVVEAVIAPATPIANATNGTAVKVTLTLQNDAGVLIAPAEALVSRLDGSYAVQVQTTDGDTKWVPVELLGVSGGTSHCAAPISPMELSCSCRRRYRPSRDVGGRAPAAGLRHQTHGGRQALGVRAGSQVVAVDVGVADGKLIRW